MRRWARRRALAWAESQRSVAERLDLYAALCSGADPLRPLPAEGETWPEALDVLVVLGPPEAETRLVLARVPPARRVAIFQRELDAKWPLAVTARKRVAPYLALCDDPGIRAPWPESFPGRARAGDPGTGDGPRPGVRGALEPGPAAA